MQAHTKIFSTDLCFGSSIGGACRDGNQFNYIVIIAQHIRNACENLLNMHVRKLSRLLQIRSFNVIYTIFAFLVTYLICVLFWAWWLALDRIYSYLEILRLKFLKLSSDYLSLLGSMLKKVVMQSKFETVFNIVYYLNWSSAFLLMYWFEMLQHLPMGLGF